MSAYRQIHVKRTEKFWFRVVGVNTYFLSKLSEMTLTVWKAKKDANIS